MKLLKLVACIFCCYATQAQQKSAPKPLYDDPVYHGAADPVVLYNKQMKTWWMFYTNRRASLPDTAGVEWVHGTKIGIAASRDGMHWVYKDTANIQYRPDEGYTFWAPDIIASKDGYHMYLTYVPGIFSNWNHPRYIIHLASNDLLNWNFVSRLNLATDKVIDASVHKVSDSLWRMWYNNERDSKSIYFADSKDLYNWQDRGKAIAARGEGPKVFYWKDRYFMIVDIWRGLEVYSSADLLQWKKQPSLLLDQPGKGKDDQALGGHCEVVVSGENAYLYYFTHPGRTKENPAARNSFDDKRSVIQVVELYFKNGEIVCDRNEETVVRLKP